MKQTCTRSIVKYNHEENRNVLATRWHKNVPAPDWKKYLTATHTLRWIMNKTFKNKTPSTDQNGYRDTTKFFSLGRKEERLYYKETT